MDRYAKLVLNTKSRMTDQVYTYKIPMNLDIEVGQRVLVPFGKGNKTSLGLVVEISREVDESISYKEIINEIESYPIVSKELIDLAFYMADKYISDLSSAIKTILPPGDIVKISEFYESTLEDSDDELLNFLEKPKTFEEIRDFNPTLTRKDLKSLVDKKTIKTRISLDREVSVKKIKLVSLIRQDQYNISKNAHKQWDIVSLLDSLEENIMVQADLMKKTGASLSSLKALEKKGILEITEKEVYREVLDNEIKDYKAHELNKMQEQVFNKINNAKGESFLLKGVTGSGKTEVYLHLVDEAIKNGKQAIVLVPEISLTPQTINRFAGRFGNRVAVLHSRLSIGERFDQWRRIREDYYDIVVGTRSAIFAPLSRLGLIIIDEEHELSYINEHNPKYDANEVASFRAHYNGCNLVLATATPRIESYYKAQLGAYSLVEMNERVENKALPIVNKVDMREELKEGNLSMFSRSLKSSIEEALMNKKQVILFLNKRGYTSYVFCRKCGYVQKCEACEASMTYHKHKNISICHLCGRTKAKPLICPSCGSNAIKEFGAGTQKLEEVAREEFPQARIGRMDADTMTKKSSYDSIYEAMDKGEIDILIGTQMVSKGFDFKEVDVVGIMSADLSLNIPDFRAAEKTFQLITQVAGRAGRGEGQGKVFIQTYNPEHYAIRASETHNYEDFYNKEIIYRKDYKYPPFYDLILLRVSHENRNEAIKKAFEINKKILNKCKGLNFEIIGPNPSIIEKINKMYRFNIIIKTCDSLEQIKTIINNEILRNQKLIGKGYRYFVMINPNSL